MMRFLSLLGCVLLLRGAASAQSPAVASVTVMSGDSIPSSTVVPVMQPAVRVTERTTDYMEPVGDLSRAERRARRAELFAARIDSLVQSRDYMFFPNSMQQRPDGMIRSIYAEYFYFGMFVDHVEVHLPTERGITQYVGMLNFDSMSIRNYRAVRLQWGWNVAFDITDGEQCYLVQFEVSTATGETVLTLVTPSVTMRYVGWLTRKNQRDRRR